MRRWLRWIGGIGALDASEGGHPVGTRWTPPSRGYDQDATSPDRRDALRAVRARSRDVLDAACRRSRRSAAPSSSRSAAKPVPAERRAVGMRRRVARPGPAREVATDRFGAPQIVERVAGRGDALLLRQRPRVEFGAIAPPADARRCPIACGERDIAVDQHLGAMAAARIDGRFDQARSSARAGNAARAVARGGCRRRARVRANRATPHRTPSGAGVTR